MTRAITACLALIGLAAFNQSAGANSCQPEHRTYTHVTHYEHVSRVHHRVHYVVLDRPSYRTVYERVYEPVPVAPYDDGPYWTSDPYERDWAYGDGPMWNAGYYGAW